MLYGINKIGVAGGHGDGANAIPSQFATTSALKSYREGTAMRVLATKIAAVSDNIVNVRPEATDISWTERARRFANENCDMAVECHTNWSLGSGGQPNHGVFLVICALYNPFYRVDKQMEMANKLFKPMADKMGLKFEIRTKKGGGEWDWYSFINMCNVTKKIKYPFIVEHGYHMDFAPNVDKFTKIIVDRYREIAEAVEVIEPEVPATPPPVTPPTQPETPSTSTKVTYQVLQGDTLYSIGKKFGVPWTTIAELNGIKEPYVIGPWMTLVIKPGVEPIMYKVLQGDTLYGIGKKFGVPWEKIAQDNGIDPPYVIGPWMTLKIIK